MNGNVDGGWSGGVSEGVRGGVKVAGSLPGGRGNGADRWDAAAQFSAWTGALGSIRSRGASSAVCGSIPCLSMFSST